MAPRPLSKGKEATFWHFTSKGMDEASRTPVLHRRGNHCVIPKKEHILWWTAYVVDKPHQKRKLRKEFEASIGKSRG